MRLICPRCGAQYEVDDSVIPEAGRDVQCSGCGQTWFQPSAKMIAAEEARRDDIRDAPEGWDIPEDPTPEGTDAQAVAPQAQPQAEPEPDAAPEPVSAPEPEPAPHAEPSATEASPIFEAAQTPEEEAEAVDWSEPFDIEEDVEPEPSELPPVTAPVMPRAPQPAPQDDQEEDVERDSAVAAIAALMQAEQTPPAAPTEPEPPTPAPPEPAPPAQEPLAETVEETTPESTPSPEPGDLGPAPRVGVVPRRALDENLLAILREEAERETAARQAEGQAIETQEEMNLAPRSQERAQERAEAPTPEPPPQVPRASEVLPRRVTPATPPPRPKFEPVAEMPKPPRREAAPKPRGTLDFSDLSRDTTEEEHAADLTEGPVSEPDARGPKRLPDIEEINSTLRASADRTGDLAAKGSPQMRAETRSGFRSGFVLVMAVVAALVALYVYAPRLAVSVPALVPVLETYVVLADAARLALDDLLRVVIAKLQAGG